MNGALARAVQRIHRSGRLPASVVDALQDTDPDWNQSPGERRWWATRNEYDAWLRAHDAVPPASSDDGAAGLHFWGNSQQDQNLTRSQRTALRQLRGWSRTASLPEWNPARVLMAALLAAGATLQDKTVHPELLVRETKTTGTETLPPPNRRRHLLTVLTFAVQTGRLPEHNEPGSRWKQTVPHEVRSVLPPSVFEQPRLVVQQHLAALQRLEELRDANLPFDSAARAAEEQWLRRHTALAKKGRLTTADCAALLRS